MIHKEEIQEKKKKVRDLMEQLQLDGILLRRQCNFSFSPWVRHRSAVLVFLSLPHNPCPDS